MSFLIKDEKLLEKHNEIWKNVSNIWQHLTVSLYTMEKYLKIKIKSFNEKINTNFHNNKIPKEGSQCICLSAIMIGSVYRKVENYHPQVLLEECKYVVKEKKMSKFITENTEISSDEVSYIKNFYKFFNLRARKFNFPKY